MTDEPSQDAKTAAAQTLKNIAQLIRNGFFPGAHAEYVKDALKFLDTMAAVPELKSFDEPVS